MTVVYTFQGHWWSFLGSLGKFVGKPWNIETLPPFYPPKHWEKDRLEFTVWYNRNSICLWRECQTIILPDINEELPKKRVINRKKRCHLDSSHPRMTLFQELQSWPCGWECLLFSLKDLNLDSLKVYKFLHNCIFVTSTLGEETRRSMCLLTSHFQPAQSTMSFCSSMSACLKAIS